MRDGTQESMSVGGANRWFNLAALASATPAKAAKLNHLFAPPTDMDSCVPSRIFVRGSARRFFLTRSLACHARHSCGDMRDQSRINQARQTGFILDRQGRGIRRI